MPASCPGHKPTGMLQRRGMPINSIDVGPSLCHAYGLHFDGSKE